MIQLNKVCFIINLDFRKCRSTTKRRYKKIRKKEKEKKQKRQG